MIRITIARVARVECGLPHVDGRLFSVLGFTVTRERVVEIDILAAPERLARPDLSALDRE